MDPTLVLVVVTLFLVLFRVFWIGRRLRNISKRKDEIVCPSCKSSYKSIFYNQIVECSKCGAEFYVDALGNADISTKRDIIINFILQIINFLH